MRGHRRSAAGPSKYNPFRRPESAQARQRYVLERMRTLQWISEEEYQNACNEPLVYWRHARRTRRRGRLVSGRSAPSAHRILTEQNCARSASIRPGYGEDYVYEAGLTVQTAMDPVHAGSRGRGPCAAVWKS